MCKKPKRNPKLIIGLIALAVVLGFLFAGGHTSIFLV